MSHPDVKPEIEPILAELLIDKELTRWEREYVESFNSKFCDVELPISDKEVRCLEEIGTRRLKG